MFTTPEWAFIIVIYLVIVAVVDMRTNRVPNWLTLPLLAALLVLRVWRGEGLTLLAYWVPAFGLWLINIAGGGDIKLLMVELALWPSPWFVAVAGGTVAIVGTAVLLSRYKSLTAFARAQYAAITRLAAGDHPSRSELELYGTPGAYLYEVAGAIFVVLAALQVIPVA